MGATNSSVSQGYALRQPCIFDAKQSLDSRKLVQSRLQDKEVSQSARSRSASNDHNVSSSELKKDIIPGSETVGATAEESVSKDKDVETPGNTTYSQMMIVTGASDKVRAKQSPIALLATLPSSPASVGDGTLSYSRIPILPVVYSPFTMFHAEHKEDDNLVTIFSYAERDLFPNLKEEGKKNTMGDYWRALMPDNKAPKLDNSASPSSIVAGNTPHSIGPSLRKSSEIDLPYDEDVGRKHSIGGNDDSQKKGAFSDIFAQIVQKLKSFIAIPGIIRFINVQSTDSDVLIVTEPVLPLRAIFPLLTQEEVTSGLYRFLETVSVLHGKGLAHGNLQLDSIFVRIKRPSNPMQAFAISPHGSVDKSMENVDAGGIDVESITLRTRDTLSLLRGLTAEYISLFYSQRDAEQLGIKLPDKRQSFAALWKDPRVHKIREVLDFEQPWALFGMELLQETDVIRSQSSTNVASPATGRVSYKPIGQRERLRNLFLLFTDPDVIPKEATSKSFKDAFNVCSQELGEIVKEAISTGDSVSKVKLLRTKLHPLVQRDLYMVGRLLDTLSSRFYTSPIIDSTDNAGKNIPDVNCNQAFPWSRMRRVVTMLTMPLGNRSSIDAVLKGPFFSESVYIRVVEFLRNIRTVDISEKPARFAALAIDIRYFSTFTLEHYILPALLTFDLLADPGCEWLFKELFVPLEYLGGREQTKELLSLHSRTGIGRIAKCKVRNAVSEVKRRSNSLADVNEANGDKSDEVTVTVTLKRLNNDSIITTDGIKKGNHVRKQSSRSGEDRQQHFISEESAVEIEREATATSPIREAELPSETMSSLGKPIVVVRGVFRLNAYDKWIMPFIAKAFAIRSYHIRLTLLRLHSFFMGPLVSYDPSLLSSLIVPELLAGLESTDKEIYSLSLAALINVIPDIFRIETALDRDSKASILGSIMSSAMSKSIPVANNEVTNESIRTLLDFICTGGKLHHKHVEKVPTVQHSAPSPLKIPNTQRSHSVTPERSASVDGNPRKPERIARPLSVDLKPAVTRRSSELVVVSPTGGHSRKKSLIVIQKKTSLMNINVNDFDDTGSVTSTDSIERPGVPIEQVSTNQISGRPKFGKMPRISSIALPSFVDDGKALSRSSSAAEVSEPALSESLNQASRSKLAQPAPMESDIRRTSVSGHWKNSSWEQYNDLSGDESRGNQFSDEPAKAAMDRNSRRMELVERSSSTRHQLAYDGFTHAELYLPKDTRVIQPGEFNNSIADLSSRTKKNKSVPHLPIYGSSSENDIVILVPPTRDNSSSRRRSENAQVSVSSGDVGRESDEDEAKSRTTLQGQEVKGTALSIDTERKNSMDHSHNRKYVLTVRMPKFVVGTISKFAGVELNFNPYSSLLFDDGNGFRYLRKYHLTGIMDSNQTRRLSKMRRKSSFGALKRFDTSAVSRVQHDPVANSTIKKTNVDIDGDFDSESDKVLLQGATKHNSPRRVTYGRVPEAPDNSKDSVATANAGLQSENVSDGLEAPMNMEQPFYGSRAHQMHKGGSGFLDYDLESEEPVRARDIVSEYLMPHILILCASRKDSSLTQDAMGEFLSCDLFWNVLLAVVESWKTLVATLEIGGDKFSFSARKGNLLSKDMLYELRQIVDSFKRIIVLVLKVLDPAEKVELFCEHLLGLREVKSCYHVDKRLTRAFETLVSQSSGLSKEECAGMFIMGRKFVVNGDNDLLFEHYASRTIDIGLSFVKDRCPLVSDFFTFSIISSLIDLQTILDGKLGARQGWIQDGLEGVMSHLSLESSNGNSQIAGLMGLNQKWDLNGRSELTLALGVGSCYCDSRTKSASSSIDVSASEEDLSVASLDDDYRKLVQALAFRFNFADTIVVRNSLVESALRSYLDERVPHLGISKNVTMPFLSDQDRVEDRMLELKLRKAYSKMIPKASVDKPPVFPVIGQRMQVRQLEYL